MSAGGVMVAITNDHHSMVGVMVVSNSDLHKNVQYFQWVPDPVLCYFENGQAPCPQAPRPP